MTLEMLPIIYLLGLKGKSDTASSWFRFIIFHFIVCQGTINRRAKRIRQILVLQNTQLQNRRTIEEPFQLENNKKAKLILSIQKVKKRVLRGEHALYI